MCEIPAVTDCQAPKGPSRRRILITTALAVSIIIAIPAVIGKVTLYRAQSISHSPYVTELGFPLLVLLATTGGIWILGRTLGRQALDLVWFRRSRRENVCAVLLIAGTPILYGLVHALFHHWGWATRTDRMFYADGLPMAFFVAMTIDIAIAAPIVEELFWRGSVQKALTSVLGAAGAWIVQAALFAAIHLRPVGGFLGVFVFGLITGLWRWRRRTLLPVILAHVAVNSLWCAVRWPGWLEMSRIQIVHDYDADRAKLSRPKPTTIRIRMLGTIMNGR